MKESLQVKVADLCLQIEGSSFPEKIKKHYTAFFSCAKPVFLLKLNFSNKLGKPEENNLQVIRRKEDSFLIQRKDFFATVDFHKFSGNAAVKKNFFSFDSFLRVFFSLFLAKNGGFLLHSAGIRKEKMAYLFSGPSLSGKTQTIRSFLPSLLPQTSILSDEIVAVRKKNSDFLAYPTPFWGSFFSIPKVTEKENIPGRIKGVFLLKKSKVKKCEKLSEKDFLIRVLPNTIFFSKDVLLVHKLMETLGGFSSKVKGYELTFPPGDTFFKNLWTRKFL